MASVELRADDEKLTHAAPLRDRVRERLEQLIIDGTYPPGQHLVETELASRLGVSRGPIREALHELKLRGWVEMRPRQGSFVRRPPTEEVDQFFHVRTLLESEAASLAAGRLTPEILDAMRKEIAAAKAAMAAGDDRRLVEANAVFHGYIHRLAGNVVLQELIEQLDKRLRWYFAPFALERPMQAWQEHEQLVAALAENDRPRAVAIMRTHTEAIRQSYLRAHANHAAEQAAAERPRRRRRAASPAP
jgi:DNA-binding GntR family transcriptional regulator